MEGSEASSGGGTHDGEHGLGFAGGRSMNMAQHGHGGYGRSPVIGPMLTQIQPLSYIPPWHLHNTGIQYQYNPLSVNGFANSGAQYSGGQLFPSYPPSAGTGGRRSGHGPSQYAPPGLSAYFQYYPPGPPGGIEHKISGFEGPSWRVPNGLAVARAVAGPIRSSNFIQKVRGGRKKSGSRSRPSRTSQTSASPNDEQWLEEQGSKFGDLPAETHRKIQKMPGNRILEYFDLILVRFSHDNVVDSQRCHVIFTTKAQTGQCWLMAFAKKSRTGTLMKFNRLLTPHLKVTTGGKTAVEIAPAKGSQLEGELFVFNFTEESDATRFLGILNELRNKLWNHEELRLAAAATAAADQATNISVTKLEKLSLDLDNEVELPEAADNDENDKGVKRLKTDGEVGLYKPPKNRASFYTSLKMDGPKGTGEDTWRNPVPPKAELPVPSPPTLALSQADVALFVQTRTGEQTLLGLAKALIWRAEGKYDELTFVRDPEGDVIANHSVYKWNSASLVAEAGGKWACTWSAAANLLSSPRTIPIVREFKVVYGLQADAVDFHNAMRESVEIAQKLKPMVISVGGASESAENANVGGNGQSSVPRFQTPAYDPVIVPGEFLTASASATDQSEEGMEH